MASYTGIHIEHSDPEAVASAIQQFENKNKNRKVRRLTPREGDAQSILSGKGALFSHLFFIHPAVDSWIEVLTSSNAWDLSELANDISAQLRCRCLVFGYQTTVAQTYYHVSENGETRRTLWYTKGQPIHEEKGDRFDFEQRYIEEQRKSLTPEDLEDIEDMNESAKETILLPDCERFAEGIGCKSFLVRQGYMDFDISKGICIKSTPKWWIFG